jgi:hypothetical protein
MTAGIKLGTTDVQNAGKQVRDGLGGYVKL